jgi:hypothetical protein
MKPLIFSIYLLLPTRNMARVYSASNTNEYQKIFLGDKARPARDAENLTAIFEPNV